MAGTMVDRMVGAAFLSVDTYEDVEHDKEATLQAGTVVAMVAVAVAIGASPLGVLGAGRAAVASLVGWLVWAGITYIVGDKLLGVGRGLHRHPTGPGLRQREDPGDGAPGMGGLHGAPGHFLIPGRRTPSTLP